MKMLTKLNHRKKSYARYEHVFHILKSSDIRRFNVAHITISCGLNHSQILAPSSSLQKYAIKFLLNMYEDELCP